MKRPCTAVPTRPWSLQAGGVKKAWLNCDLKELPDIYNRCTAASNKLEGAEFKLVATAQKLHHKHTLALAKAAKKGHDITTVKPPVPDADLESATVADRYVPRSERPTHRLPPFKWLPFGLPFMGEKVDTIEWARKEVIESDQLLTEGRPKLAEDRANVGVDLNENYPPLNSAFILFNQQIGAHIAAQILVYNQPYRMAEKYTEVAPADMIWGNLGINPYEARIRKAISYAATAALIIFWAFPVAFVGRDDPGLGLTKPVGMYRHELRKYHRLVLRKDTILLVWKSYRGVNEFRSRYL